MKGVSVHLGSMVETFYRKHKNIDDRIASKKPDTNEWSLKEIIGHLVNSASNNHQRFVGLQTVGEMVFPEYQKHHLEWIGLERLNELEFSGLFLLWKQYNLLMAHIITNIDSTKLENYLVMPDKTVSLQVLVNDYVRHLKLHLNQFEETLKKVK